MRVVCSLSAQPVTAAWNASPISVGSSSESIALAGKRLFGGIGTQRLRGLGQAYGGVRHQGLGVLYGVEEGLLVGARRRPLFERGEQALIEFGRPIRRVALVVSQ